MNMIKLQVPIDKEVRDALAERATSLGFDSIQAYIRVWAKAETEGRQISFEKPVVLSQKADARYGKMVTELETKKKLGKIETFTTTKDFMRGL